MKKTFLAALVAACSLLLYKPADAQFHASVNINIQPAWGPSGYDYAENYYLPDVEAYYCVPRHQFVYYDRGNWVYASSLPGRYANYDLYTGYKVVLNEREPWMHFSNHRSMYAGYRFRHDQVVIRDRGSYRRVGHPAYEDHGWGRDRVYDRRGHDGGRDRDRNNSRRGNDNNDRRHNDDHNRHDRGGR